MTDEPSQDKPVEELPGVNSPGNDELEKLLTDAADLANELSDEVGTSDPSEQVASPRESPTGGSEDEAADAPNDELDSQLQELEQILEIATTDLGTHPSPEEPSPTSQPKPDYDVPDFMQEFTESEAPPPDSSGLPAPDSAEEAFEDTTLIADDQAIDAASPGETDGELPDVFAVLNDAQGAAKPDDLHPGSGGKLGSVVAGKLGAAILPICDRGVALLERIDGPLQRIGHAPRQLIGLVAIATIGVSLIVILLSFF